MHLVGYLYYWQMGLNSMFKGLRSIIVFAKSQYSTTSIRFMSINGFTCDLFQNYPTINTPGPSQWPPIFPVPLILRSGFESHLGYGDISASFQCLCRYKSCNGLPLRPRSRIKFLQPTFLNYKIGWLWAALTCSEIQTDKSVCFVF